MTPEFTIDDVPEQFITRLRNGRAYITVSRAEQLISQEKRDFDVVDRLGRTIGAAMTRLTVTCEPVIRDASASGYVAISQWTGTRIMCRPHALRDGNFYGASHDGKIFRTDAEADAYTAKYFADAEKRARKIAAKGSGE